jgi:hypothetical protein
VRWCRAELRRRLTLFFTSQWPNMTLLTVIGLSYSIIAPLICGFAFVAFFLYWFVYKVSSIASSHRCV